eukprot:CAMPEP_0171325136 /NCGR_PEP_ID=MMETSP0816-20121228/116618_1 /TAXON_ID=420281 /ORGANISM="Proboscia inermis, Strain CCAP1064/1" /LENGTH=448 /DNA_ID=CAMNT_0011824235 /DNA_START=347 /DNA_END=1693 /DNA_ORIENTATION=+
MTEPDVASSDATNKTKLSSFVTEECYPAEIEYDQHLAKRIGSDRWSLDAIPPCVERLKNRAKQLGLWNLFLPKPIPNEIRALCDQDNASFVSPSMYLSNREYGVLCEIMGRSLLASEACNCNAPDTGNMEVLLKHGSLAQQIRYLKPLLMGQIRSAFLMTEPDVASSDATNIETTLTKVVSSSGNVHYVLNGKKWWSTGAMDPRCKVALVLAKMDHGKVGVSNTNPSSKHGAHTVVIIPMDAPGVKLVRPLTVFGYDDAPHGHAEVQLTNVVCGPDTLILGEGKGFEIAQSRLGPGRIHHCMRAVGLASRCYDLMILRSMSRTTFGKPLYQHGGCQEMIADSATDIQTSRLLTLSCAASIDQRGPRGARDQIAMIKVAVPEMTLRVVDRAIQVFGGAGVCNDFPLARAFAGLRTLRIADGPDAVHRRTLALLEVKRAKLRQQAMRSSL